MAGGDTDAVLFIALCGCTWCLICMQQCSGFPAMSLWKQAVAGGGAGPRGTVCSFRKALPGKKCWIAMRRLDFVRGFHGSHVRDYVRATEPSFVVGEYWDSLSYNGGLPDHNQVLTPWRITSLYNDPELLGVESLCCTLLCMQKPRSSTNILLHGCHAIWIAAALVLSTL